jgi:hypothetical protein
MGGFANSSNNCLYRLIVLCLAVGLIEAIIAVMTRVALILLMCLPVVSCRSGGAAEPGSDVYEDVSAEMEKLEGEFQSKPSREKPQDEKTPATARNVRIVIQALSTYLEDYGDIDALWRYANTFDTVVEHPEIFDQSGMKVGIAGDAFKVKLRAAKGRIRTAEQAQFLITIADGETGFISIGKRVYALGFDYLGRWYNSVDYPFDSVERYLKVKPQVLSTGKIAIEVTPVLFGLFGESGDLELTMLLTRVVLREGQMVVLGGSSSVKEDLSTMLFSSTVEARERRTIVTLTASLH